LLPGPCWGKKQGQDIQYEETPTQFCARLVCMNGLLPRTVRMADAADSMMLGYFASEGDAQLVDTSRMCSDRPVPQIQP
jgi:hypothetical protein